MITLTLTVYISTTEKRIRGSPEHSVNRVRINRPDALAWASDLPPRARVKHHVDDKAWPYWTLPSR